MPRKPKPQSLPPEMPLPTEKEMAANRQIALQLQQLCVQLHQRNLNNAVLLAQQAARGRGPLVAHFGELGRRYAELLDQPQKPQLRVIEGRSV